MMNKDAKEKVCPLRAKNTTCITNKCIWWMPNGLEFGDCAVVALAKTNGRPTKYEEK